jgi:hypothetical protein
MGRKGNEATDKMAGTQITPFLNQSAIFVVVVVVGFLNVLLIRIVALPH